MNRNRLNQNILLHKQSIFEKMKKYSISHVQGLVSFGFTYNPVDLKKESAKGGAPSPEPLRTKKHNVG
jgi:hypothetical protein